MAHLEDLHSMPAGQFVLVVHSGWPLGLKKHAPAMSSGSSVRLLMSPLEKLPAMVAELTLLGIKPIISPAATIAILCISY